MVYLRGWFAAPPKRVELDLDDLTFFSQFFRFCMVAIACEGIVAIQILWFLSTHGQL